jgi:hypothetical protein
MKNIDEWFINNQESIIIIRDKDTTLIEKLKLLTNDD